MSDDVVPRPETQGQRKIKQIMSDLFSNVVFKMELDDILAMPNKRKREKRLIKFANKYRLEYEMGSYIMNMVLNHDAGVELRSDVGKDLCEVYDEEDLYLNPQFPVDFLFPPSRHPRIKAQILAYPIHIGISPYATKRDVLDYISKRWDEIGYLLSQYTPNEKSVITRRRLKAERDELIWENRGLPAKEVAEIVNAKFPDENLTYSDINSILYYLKRRRLSSLA